MRVVQNTRFLLDMLREVSRGQLVPAAFQRPYVWEVADIQALTTSILEGYPIGGFLSWYPGPKADLSALGRHRLGPITRPTNARSQGLLLDGQNRLATLAWIMRDETTPLPSDCSEAELSAWGSGKGYVVNLDTRTLEFVPEAEAFDGFRLPARALLESSVANPLIRKRWNNEWTAISEEILDAGMHWFDRASAAFRESRVVETVLENASPDEAKKAFLHICKVGVPMSDEDFDKAIGWAAPKNISANPAS